MTYVVKAFYSVTEEHKFDDIAKAVESAKWIKQEHRDASVTIEAEDLSVMVYISEAQVPA